VLFDAISRWRGYTVIADYPVGFDHQAECIAIGHQDRGVLRLKAAPLYKYSALLFPHFNGKAISQLIGRSNPRD
jgi:hypothetical protein